MADGKNQELLSRLQAIRAPLEEALREGYGHADLCHRECYGDFNVLPRIDRDIAMRLNQRLGILEDDIASGLYDAERPDDGR